MAQYVRLSLAIDTQACGDTGSGGTALCIGRPLQRADAHGYRATKRFIGQPE